MEHPHLSADCSLDMSGGELSCDNTPRFRFPRLTDAGNLEVTCQMAAHEVSVSELPDDTLETELRRLLEQSSDRDDVIEQLRSELADRDIDVPVASEDLAWCVVELTEAETRDLQEGAYPEAYQMSKSIEDTSDDEMWSQADDDDLRAMKISTWALENVPADYEDRATRLDDADYADDFFG